MPTHFNVVPDYLYRSSKFPHVLWVCRLATPAIRPPLMHALDASKKAMLNWEKKVYCRNKFTSNIPTSNPFRARYIHLFNLHVLLSFVIPSVQDYGIALKLNNLQTFLDCYRRLYITILNSNSSVYMRCMLLYYMLIMYWKENNMLISVMLQSNVTFFSEESGQIAISYLAQLNLLHTELILA